MIDLLERIIAIFMISSCNHDVCVHIPRVIPSFKIRSATIGKNANSLYKIQTDLFIFHMLAKPFSLILIKSFGSITLNKILLVSMM